MEAFKAGTLDFRAENSAKNWATEYDFPARRRGNVILEEFRFETVEPFQGYVFNLRREKFQDRRVREAFNLAFDFEWLNDNIFFGQYARTRSYFQGSEMEATGLPEGLELEILEMVRDQVPEEVFTTEFTNPVGGGDRAMRNNLRQAAELLAEAGYDIQNGVRVHRESGQTLSVEFLFVDPSSERILSPYQQRLQQLGIRVSLRRVDPSQYQNRVMDHDFDAITLLYPQSLSPGNEQRSYFGTEAADSPTSRNFGGIKNPAVDAIIDRLIFAEDRETLVASARALDRVLMWNRYHMPQFHSPTDRVARWDIFGLPETLPPYASTAAATLDLWWFDAEKAQRIRRN